MEIIREPEKGGLGWTNSTSSSSEPAKSQQGPTEAGHPEIIGKK